LINKKLQKDSLKLNKSFNIIVFRAINKKIKKAILTFYNTSDNLKIGLKITFPKKGIFLYVFIII